MNRYLVKIFRELLFALVITLSVTSCSENSYDSAIATRKTILVYMIANNSLSSYADENIDSMLVGMKSCNVGDNLLIYEEKVGEAARLLKMAKQSDGTVKRSVLKNYREQNSVSSTVMASVLSDMTEYSPSQSYGLVLWSHGYGWFPPNSRTKTIATRWFGQDGTNNMAIEDLKTALISGGLHWDSILFDACFMGGVEIDYALRNTADYIIASPSEVLGQGFPYQTILPFLFGKTEMDYTEVAKAYYRYYKDLPITVNTYPSATIGCIKCSELEHLADVTRGLIAAHDAEIACLDASNVQHLEGYNPHLFYDFGDFIHSFLSLDECTIFDTQLNKTVIYKAATPRILSATSYSNNYITVKSFSGLNTYILQKGLDADNIAYRNTEWYMAISGIGMGTY